VKLSPKSDVNVSLLLSTFYDNSFIRKSATKFVLIALGDTEKLYVLREVRLAGLRSLVSMSRRLLPHLQYPAGAVKPSDAN